MRAVRKETSENRSSFVQLVLILFQVWVSRKNVPESEGYPYTWWLVEHSEACLCRCLSTRRYVQGDQKCSRFHRPDRKFLSGNWSSSSYHASYWGGSWWVSRRKIRDSYNARARNTKVLYYCHPDNIYPVRVCFLREIHLSRDSV